MGPDEQRLLLPGQYLDIIADRKISNARDQVLEIPNLSPRLLGLLLK